MVLIPRIGFALVKWKSRHGLRGNGVSASDAKKQEALQFGVRGEKRMLFGTCGASAIFSLRGTTGETDLIGFDRDTLVFVEVRTRAKEEGKIALPALSITPEKHHVLVRTAHYFLRERHIKECPLRFDVVDIDKTPGHPRVVRLHKAALSPQA